MPALARIAPVLLLALVALVLSGCPESPPPKSADTPEEQPAPSDEVQPLRLTPGLYLVYTVNDPRSAAIATDPAAHVLIADPEGKRREILFAYPGFIFHVVPSPIGAHVAFVATRRGEEAGEERHLFLYDLAQDRYMDVSEAGFYSRAVKTAPLFTPDGSTVLFLSRWRVDSGEFNVFKCDVATGRTSGLYTDPVEDVPMGMTPDGRSVVAVRRIPNVPGSFEYISIDIESGAATVLHHFENVTKVGPALFDPDRSTVYCDIKPFETGGTPLGGIRSRSVLAIDLSEGTERTLLDPATVTYVYHVFTAEHGEIRLLLRRQEDIEGEDTPMSRIASSRLDGSDFQYLTTTDARCYLLPPPSNIPPLSPDHSLLFFYRQDPDFDHEDIWVMKPDGSDPVNISNTAGYNEGSAGWIDVRGNEY